jgi:glycosyltransferase involved in cell wall biosynthesis
MCKKRILFVGEASYLGTGFSTYWNEVIKRIHATNEFEIAEMGSYSFDGDPRIQSIPWKFYSVVPHPNDAKGNQIFKSDVENQFGKWRFDQICLDFKPDIVATLRDFWMDNFINHSPYRKYFKLIWQLTIDGVPQRDLWLDAYKQCDACLTYSKWGMDVMKKEGFAGTNLLTIASPGADLDVFKPPANKKDHKTKMGIDPNSIIIGTVMRNQKRKLYYDLIESFAKWVQKAKTKGHTELVRKTFLYLHTSYPDVGYDIAKAIQEFGVGNKVIMTYLCSNCGVVYPSFFNGELAICRKCKTMSAHPPNANASCSREVLANIMQCFDLYVQYSISEGWGMPLTDAMACGIPCMAVRYSAMEDHLKCPTSIPIEVGRFFYESIVETEQRRALPDNNDFVNKLDHFIKLSEEKRNQLSIDTRNYAVENDSVYGQNEKLPRFSWDRTAAIWQNILREYPIYDPKDTWLNTIPNIYKPKLSQSLNQLNNLEFIRSIVANVLNRPDLINSQFAIEWIKYLNAGFRINGNERINVDRKYVIDTFMKMIEYKNNMEINKVNLLNKQELCAQNNGIAIGIY